MCIRDRGMAQAAALRIAGSRDIYADHDRKNASVNFITCHDGFTLYDLFSYNVKHNESNGWNNTDGANDNNSWNCEMCIRDSFTTIRNPRGMI